MEKSPQPEPQPWVGDYQLLVTAWTDSFAVRCQGLVLLPTALQAVLTAGMKCH